jgi:hypothetical protein
LSARGKELFAIAVAVIIGALILTTCQRPSVRVGQHDVPVVASQSPVDVNFGVQAPAPVATPPSVNQVASPAVVVKAKHKPRRISKGEAEAYAKAYANAARANQLLGEHRFNTAGAEFIGLHRALGGWGTGFVVRTIAVDGG